MTETEKDISRELADYYKEIDRILTEMGKDKESISKLLRDGRGGVCRHSPRSRDG